MEGARPVRAPRGTTLTARSWQTEAPLRMLQNNLDPEVAERPDDLVVYGGTGRAARNWAAFDAMVRTLTTLGRRRDAARPVRQAGRRDAHARVGAAGADRQLQPGRRLGDLAGVPPARAARPDDVRPDDGRLVDLHRHPGHPAGHLRDVRRGRRQALRRHARRHAHRHRRLRRHGRRAAARGHPERRRVPGRRRRPGPAAAPRRAPLPRRAGRRPRRRRRHAARPRSARAARLSVGLVGNCADGAAGAAAPRRRRRHRHRPDLRPRPAVLPADRRRRSRTGTTTPRPSRRSSPTGPARRWPGTSRPWSGSWTRAPRSSTTATRSATRPATAASSARSTSPASCPPTSGRCSARARGRSAGPRCPATRRTSHATDQAVLDLFPDNDHLHRWIRAAQERSRSRACPRASAGSATASATRPGLRFNEHGRRRASVSAPIVIGRDHLDCRLGRLALPRDRGDGRRLRRDRRLAAAQRAGQHRVRRDLGVDPPRRRRRHRPLDPRRAGHAWPTAPRWPRRKLERVLTNDPGMGVIRHVDAGYDDGRRRSPPSAASASRCAEQLTVERPSTRCGPSSDRSAATRAPAATGASPGRGEDADAARVVRRRGARPAGSTSPPTAPATSGPGGAIPDADGPGVVTGSHLDSVPDGGAFDGPLGVVCAFAAVDALRARGVRAGAADRASSTSATRRAPASASPAPGSRLITGALTADRAAGLHRRRRRDRWPRRCAAAGHDPRTLGRDDGGAAPDRHLRRAARRAGPGRWPTSTGPSPSAPRSGRTAAGGSTCTGEANHAGTTRLADRHDPMLALAARRPAPRRAAAERTAPSRPVGKVRVEPERRQRDPVAASRPGSTPAAPTRPTVRAVVADGRGGAGGHARSRSRGPTDTAFDPALARAAGRRCSATRRVLPTGAGHDAGILAAAGVPDRDALRPQPDRRLALARRARRGRPTAWPGVDALTRRARGARRDEPARTWCAARRALAGGLARDVLVRDRRRPVHRRDAPGPRPATRDGCPASRCPASPTPTATRSTARCAGAPTPAAARSGPGASGCTRVAARLDPDSYLALARAVYAEMALAGITAVGEFHYLHHAPGRHAATPTRTRWRDALRAGRAPTPGIRLTLLDTCYLAGGLDADGHRAAGRSPAALRRRRRRRVGRRGSPTLHDVRRLPGRRGDPLGARGAARRAGRRSSRPPTGRPLHVHLSEQPAENEACLARYG